MTIYLSSSLGCSKQELKSQVGKYFVNSSQFDFLILCLPTFSRNLLLQLFHLTYIDIISPLTYKYAHLSNLKKKIKHFLDREAPRHSLLSFPALLRAIYTPCIFTASIFIYSLTPDRNRLASEPFQCCGYATSGSHVPNPIDSMQF